MDEKPFLYGPKHLSFKNILLGMGKRIPWEAFSLNIKLSLIDFLGESFELAQMGREGRVHEEKNDTCV